ncbi:MAG: S-layer homology domain-containing protein [Coleofasciculaceae cyanobacterium]
MSYRFRRLLNTAGLVFASSIGTASVIISAQVSAQENFPDVEPDYWASPFIQTLSEKGIVTGYLDGTFRPEQPIDRDEFAAIIRQAFAQEEVKQIPRGSVFKDVPTDYWAAPPIEEAYETGFMKASSENLFQPKEELSKLQAIVSLVEGLNLAYTPPVVATAQAQVASPSQRSQKPRAAKNRLVFPLATTALMQPFLQAASPPPTPPAQGSQPTVAQSQSTPSTPSASEFLKSHYEDAKQIPKEAMDEIAAATQAGVVVNYPNPNLINPNGLLSRGEASALIYQALVYQNKLEKLPNNAQASEYIVNP